MKKLCIYCVSTAVVAKMFTSDNSTDILTPNKASFVAEGHKNSDKHNAWLNWLYQWAMPTFLSSFGSSYSSKLFLIIRTTK